LVSLFAEKINLTENEIPSDRRYGLNSFTLFISRYLF
jgi:hypothetical protein